MNTLFNTSWATLYQHLALSLASIMLKYSCQVLISCYPKRVNRDCLYSVKERAPSRTSRGARGRSRDLLIDSQPVILPLPEPMLTDHQWSPVTLILGQFRKRCLNHQSLKCIWKLHKLSFKSSRGQLVKDCMRSLSIYTSMQKARVILRIGKGYDLYFSISSDPVMPNRPEIPHYNGPDVLYQNRPLWRC